MKKIICALIALCSIFALIACGGNNNNGNGDGTVSVATFQTAINNTTPAFATVKTSVTTALGTLNAQYEITYRADGSASIDYNYERFNKLGEGADNEIKSVYTGTINRSADGTLTGDVNDAPNLNNVAAGTAMNLAAIAAENVTISESGDTLTASVAKDSTLNVFGAAYTEDVNLVITIANGKIDSIKITGDTMSIDCSYKY